MTASESPPPAAREESRSGVCRLVWRKLKEMRTAFYLLAVLALASLVAAVLPQQQPPEYYLERFGQFGANLIGRLALDHVSTAPWFFLLLAGLMLSLVACTGNLWRLAQSRWRVPGTADLARVAAHVRDCAPRTVASDADEALATARAAAARAGFQSWEIGERDRTRYVYLCRHRRSAWGTALTHYAIFLVGLGALLGALPGVAVDEFLDVKEGAVGQSPTGRLPFAVRLDSFRVETEPRTQAVRNYYSEVTLLEGDREVGRHTISVNHPLKYRGFYLSQVSWSLGEAKVQLRRKGQTSEVAFPLAQAADAGQDPSAPAWGVPEDGAVALLPSGRDALLAGEFYPSARRENGQVVGQNSELPDCPALRLVLVSGLPPAGAPRTTPGALPGAAQPGHRVTDLGFLLQGETRHTVVGDVTFTGVSEASGLGVRRDPGVPLVWAGFLACIVGLVLLFYFPVTQAYLAVSASADCPGASEVRLQVRGGLLSDPGGDARRLLGALGVTYVETARGRQP